MIEHLLVEYRHRMCELLVGAPVELVEELTPTLAANTVSDSDLIELQSELPVPLPPSLLAYLAGPEVQSGFEWSEIIIPSNSDLRRIGAYISTSELWPLELIQIGTGPCGDPLCLDYSGYEEDFEYPVVVIEHDSATPDHWRDSDLIRTLVTARWSSFFDLLQVVCKGEPVVYRSLWAGS